MSGNGALLSGRSDDVMCDGSRIPWRIGLGRAEAVHRENYIPGFGSEMRKLNFDRQLQATTDKERQGEEIFVCN